MGMVDYGDVTVNWEHTIVSHRRPIFRFTSAVSRD